MKDLKTLACVFGMIAAVLLCAFFGIILLRASHGVGTTIPATL
jgi:hypothetical protein